MSALARAKPAASLSWSSAGDGRTFGKSMTFDGRGFFLGRPRCAVDLMHLRTTNLLKHRKSTSIGLNSCPFDGWLDFVDQHVLGEFQ